MRFLSGQNHILCRRREDQISLQQPRGVQVILHYIIPLFYTIIGILTYHKFKVPKYYLFVLSYNTLLQLGVLKSFNEAEVLDYFSLVCLVTLMLYPFIEKKNKYTLSFPLLVCIVHVEKSNFLQLIITGCIFVWIICNAIEVFRNQYNKSCAINVFLIVIIITLLNQVTTLIIYFERVWNYKLIIDLLQIVIALFIGILPIIAKSSKKNYLYTWSEEKKQFESIVSEYRKDEQPNSKSQFNTAFTGRELEVLELVARGLTSKEISERMYLSKKTIDHYRARIKDKLGYSKKSELVEFVLSRTDSTSPNIKHASNKSKIMQKAEISI